MLGDGKSEPFQSTGTATGGVTGTECWVRSPYLVGAVGSSEQEGGSQPELDRVRLRLLLFRLPLHLLQPRNLILPCCPWE